MREWLFNWGEGRGEEFLKMMGLELKCGLRNGFLDMEKDGNEKMGERGIFDDMGIGRMVKMVKGKLFGEYLGKG